MMVLRMRPGLGIAHKSMMLARDTLLRSGLPDESVLIGTGDEDAGGVPRIYFDFRTPSGDVCRRHVKK